MNADDVEPSFNPFNKNLSKFDLDNDEELLQLNDSVLRFNMNDEEDFCLCRRCRASSNLSHRAGHTPPSSRSFLNQQNSNSSNQGYRPFDSNSTRTRPINGDNLTYEINRGNSQGDDVPLLLDDSFHEVDLDHCHFPKSSSGVQRARKQLIISSVLCVTFMLMEFIGGYISGSLAIMTDAAHLLSDLASFLISLFAIWVGQKAPTKRMSFGYYRAEILGAVASVLIIWVLTGVLVFMAIERIRTHDFEIEGDAMIIVSGAGVAINIIMGIVLHGCCFPGFGGSHSHHGHSHGSANINVRAAFIHVLGDLIQSVGVLIAAYVIRFYPQYKIADPICTFIFSALVLFTTISIMRDAVWVLMEGFPRNLSYSEILSMLKKIDGVQAAHSLHIWSLTTDKNALAVHLAIKPEADTDRVLRQAQFLIRKEFSVLQATIQVERYQNQMSSCSDCQCPD